MSKFDSGIMDIHQNIIDFNKQFNQIQHIQVGPPEPNQIWKDGAGVIRIGPPGEKEIWTDGQGFIRHGPPDNNQRWFSK